MRPILAIIPALPHTALPPLLGIVVVAALVFAAYSLKARNAVLLTVMPLIATTIGVVLILVQWTRHAVTLHSYGLFLILGFAAATSGACVEARRKGFDPNMILDLALPLLVASIVSCRLLYILLNRSQFHTVGDMLRVWDGGLSFHGSLFAAPMVVWFYADRNRLSFGQLADIIAPSVFLGYGIGRIGCLFNGCCYGKVCDLPWAMRFPDEFNRSVLTPPSHPTQIYSFILAMLLFGVMQVAKRSPAFTRFHGELTLLFFTLYAAERGFVEYFRNGATARTVFGTSWLTQAQLASGIAFIVIFVLWLTLDGRVASRLRRPNSDAGASL